MTKDYEVSGAYVESLVRTLTARGLFDQVLALQGPRVERMMKNPWCDNWHVGFLHEAFGEGVLRVGGAEAYEALSYQAMKDRFANIILPLLRYTMNASQNSPAAIFSKLHSSVPSAIRGLEIAWGTRPDGSGGALEILYPREVPVFLDISWRGVFRYVIELTKRPAGRVEEFQHAGRALRYVLAW